MRAYEASIAYLDDRLGRLLDSLSERGLLENTLVVLTSDHGEEFGEHGSFGHGGNLYFEQTHVPLVLSWPGRLPEGMVIDTPVSIQDVPATIDRIARDDARRTFPGASLRASGMRPVQRGHARWWPSWCLAASRIKG